MTPHNARSLKVAFYKVIYLPWRFKDQVELQAKPVAHQTRLAVVFFKFTFDVERHFVGISA